MRKTFFFFFYGIIILEVYVLMRIFDPCLLKFFILILYLFIFFFIPYFFDRDDEARSQRWRDFSSTFLALLLVHQLSRDLGLITQRPGVWFIRLRRYHPRNLFHLVSWLMVAYRSPSRYHVRPTGLFSSSASHYDYPKFTVWI